MIELLDETTLESAKNQLKVTGEWKCFYKAIEIDFYKDLEELDSANHWDMECHFPLDLHSVKIPTGYIFVGLRQVGTENDEFGIIKLEEK